MTERESLDLGVGFRRNSWKAFRFVLQFLRPHLRRMVLVCLIDVSITLLNLTVPWFGKNVVDRAFPQRDWSAIGVIAASVASILLLVLALSSLRNYLYNVTELRIGLEIRRRVASHLQRLSLDSTESMPVGQQQFRVTTDADRIAHMLVRILPTLTMLVEFGLILAAAIYVDRTLTLIVLGFLLPWTFLFIWVTHYGRILDRRRLHIGEMRDTGILQAANSFSAIKSLGRSRRELRRNAKVSVALQRVAAQGYLILVGFEFATQKLIPFAKTTTIYLLLARKVVLGQMTLGMTVPMISYLGRLTYPIERIVNFACWIWQTMVSAERMMQILQTEPGIQDKPGAIRMPIRGEVAFEGVSFDRPELGRVLDGVDLKLAPGKTIAVVGPSGAGKSTLMAMALRLLDPSEGLVTVDGMALTDLDRTFYLRQTGTVMQDTFIFQGSLADNLRFADPDATDAKLAQVLESVGLGAWLAALPDGLGQDLDGGLALSVGQKQRIGIARALVGEPKVVFLDEPTSALDVRTEREIMATIRAVCKDRAVMLVTHRLETVKSAHEIVVLDRGRVVERGTHTQLMRGKGLYARLQGLYASRNDAPVLQEATT